MRYSKYLYLSEDLKKKKQKIIRKLEQNKLQLGVILLTLPQQDHNQLEIIESKLLLQPSYPKSNLFVVGIVSDYEEAYAFVEKMALEVYENTGDMNIRGYIMNKEQED